jgi:hypothetical protein
MRWSPARKPATGLTCSFRPDAPVLMLRLLGRRPEGAVTNQPRATPWDHVQQPGPSTESAIQNSVLGGLRARKSRDLWRPYRAFPFLESRFPGRCPGLACCFPFGAEFQNSATSKRASEGIGDATRWPLPASFAGESGCWPPYRSAVGSEGAVTRSSSARSTSGSAGCEAASQARSSAPRSETGQID